MRMINRGSTILTLVLLSASGVALAQDQPAAPQGDQPQASGHGWRRVTEPPPAPEPDAAPPADREAPPADENQAPPPAPVGPMQARGPLDAYGQPRYAQDAPPPQDPRTTPSQQAPVPDRLTIKPGMYVTVRMNQALSSDHNQPGDAFTATLVSPLVVDGIVVAHRGQTIAGHVTEARKAGRVEGVSRLGVQLTELTLADGQQVPFQSQLISRVGDTAYGRDAAGIGASTATGAAIGGMVNGGVGAGIGAAAGALAGTLGVLFTRGYPTYITPETVLTFRVEAPVTVDTTQAPMAFQYVQPAEYAQSELASRRPMPPPRPAYPPPYYYRPAYYAPYYYRPYWGPSFGPGFYYGGRGYYHRWH